MKEMQHIMSTFRHGNYGGAEGKPTDHKVVHINRSTGTLELVSEVVHEIQYEPEFAYVPLDLTGYKLYRYRGKNSDNFSVKFDKRGLSFC